MKCWKDWQSVEPKNSSVFVDFWPHCNNRINRTLKEAEDLTNERKKTHGSWIDQSAFALILKEHLRKGPNWTSLDASKKESLDMIAVKISRLLHGNPEAEDHWDDISGYAFLGKSGHKI